MGVPYQTEGDSYKPGAEHKKYVREVHFSAHRWKDSGDLYQ